MFGVEITDHYVVYDHDKQCRDVGSLYPAIDIKLYGKKSKKVRMHDCWYSEFLFQSTAASVHYTQRGNYLHFRLTDYGVKDVRGVFCQVLHEGAPINNKEYYQTILYDANDSFSLYTPVNEEIMTESISLCITGVKYWNNDQIIESTSYPQKITAKQKKINQGIRSARDQHTALPIEKTTGKVTKSTRKLPFAEEYIEMAWIWYPELSELFTWVSSQCDLLEEEISALPQSIMGVDCSTPNENDKVIFIPIECTFNQKFYARLFLAQNHTVEGRIVSPLDMLQYQIPIRAENEPLLLCLYGTHWLDPLMLSPGDAIGDDKCKNTYSDAETNSPILRIIGEIKDRVSHRYSERTVQSSNVMRRFYRSIEALRTWIKERYTEVSSLSQEARPSLWTSEYRLYQYIKLLCSDAVYQYRSSWLDTQSLDIFIPQYSCAIEYQGQQHYDAIDYFGGEAKLLMQREMDADKRQKCQNNGVKLIEWSYKEKRECISRTDRFHICRAVFVAWATFSCSGPVFTGYICADKRSGKSKAFCATDRNQKICFRRKLYLRLQLYYRCRQRCCDIKPTDFKGAKWEGFYCRWFYVGTGGHWNPCIFHRTCSAVFSGKHI